MVKYGYILAYPQRFVKIRVMVRTCGMDQDAVTAKEAAVYAWRPDRKNRLRPKKAESSREMVAPVEQPIS